MSLKEDDQIVYYFQFDENLNNIVLHIACKNPISPKEYLLCLRDFCKHMIKTLTTYLMLNQNFAIKHNEYDKLNKNVVIYKYETSWWKTYKI